MINRVRAVFDGRESNYQVAGPTPDRRVLVLEGRRRRGGITQRSRPLREAIY
jgi:hypothetical protein